MVVVALVLAGAVGPVAPAAGEPASREAARGSATMEVAREPASLQATQESATPEPSMRVDLRENGSARITLTMTFDLSNGTQAQRYNQLAQNQSARFQVAAVFMQGMRSVAEGAQNRTGREMAVTQPDVNTYEQNQAGVLEVSVTYAGLAAVEGDRLVVSEPFSGGYTPDRTFVLTAPEGYEIAEATPQPASTSDDGRVATWSADSDLEAFSVTAAPRGDGTPWWLIAGGVVLVLGAAAVAGIVAYRREWLQGWAMR